jgi:hypothetical protein
MTKPVYNFALSDWFYPPVIHRVDLRQGETIRIQVHPDDDMTAAEINERARQGKRVLLSHSSSSNLLK